MRAKCEARLPELDREILQIHRSIVTLSQRLAKLTEQRLYRRNLSTTCAQLLSSLRWLPLETLGEIFSYCIPPNPIPHVRLASLSISQVCSVWRSATLAFPHLWTELSLEYFDYRGRPSKASVQNLSNLMTLWCDRARTSSLTLRLEICHDSPREILKHDNKSDKVSIAETIIPYAGRFRELHLISSSIHDVRDFLRLSPGHVGELESLHLQISHFHGTVLGNVSVFAEAPRLREVTLVANKLFNPYSNLSLPWSQLTKLFLGVEISPDELYEVFLRCTQLISGVFSVNSGNAQTFNQEPITLESLVDLRVTLRYKDNTFNLFDRLWFPSLRKYELSAMGGRSLISMAPLQGFLRRVHNLQELTLGEFYAAPRQNLLSILESTPNLVKLTLRLVCVGREYDSGLIRALTLTENQSIEFLPSLTFLDLNIIVTSDNFRLDEHELVTMLRSRQIRGVALPPVAYLKVFLDISCDHCGWFSLDILNRARNRGEIEIDVLI